MGCRCRPASLPSGATTPPCCSFTATAKPWPPMTTSPRFTTPSASTSSSPITGATERRAARRPSPPCSTTPAAFWRGCGIRCRNCALPGRCSLWAVLWGATPPLSWPPPHPTASAASLLKAGGPPWGSSPWASRRQRRKPWRPLTGTRRRPSPFRRWSCTGSGTRRRRWPTPWRCSTACGAATSIWKLSPAPATTT